MKIGNRNVIRPHPIPYTHKILRTRKHKGWDMERILTTPPIKKEKDVYEISD